jgi:hypothetical protein
MIWRSVPQFAFFQNKCNNQIISGANKERTPIMTSFQLVGAFAYTGGRGSFSVKDIGIRCGVVGGFGNGTESET